MPLDKAGKVTDDTRIRAALPTIKFLVVSFYLYMKTLLIHSYALIDAKRRPLPFLLYYIGEGRPCDPLQPLGSPQGCH